MPSTPIPNAQVQQAITTLDDAVKQGVVGVLLLLCVIGVIVAAAAFLMVWSRRNQKTNDGAINDALTTFARMNENQLKQAQLDKEWQRKVDMRRDVQIKRMNARHIEAMGVMSDSNNRLADNLAAQAGILNAIVNRVNEMDNMPLQQAIETINQIKRVVDSIAKRQDEDQIFYQRCATFLTNAEQVLMRIEEKHKTSEIQAVADKSGL